MLKATKGAGVPEALFGGTGADGKGSKRQNLPSMGAKDAITGGDPLARTMGHYGKATPSYLPTPQSDPVSSHPAMGQVRGSSGGVKTHPKLGGLGPGPMGATGSATDYPKDSDQT